VVWEKKASPYPTMDFKNKGPKDEGDEIFLGESGPTGKGAKKVRKPLAPMNSTPATKKGS